MKRELAFALEARSQFGCFTGRTRASEASPDQFSDGNVRSKEGSSAKSIDEVHVNRRRKRVKTDVPDVDSVKVDGSKGSEESEAVVVNGEEESAAAEALNGGEEAAEAVEVGKGEEEGRRSREKVNVKRKKRKNQVIRSTPKRFTRSAVKEKDENLEELGTPARKKLELKMSKKIGLDRMPTNMRGLLETGLLEGLPVYYKLDNNEGKNLQGIIKGVGILCSCDLCESTDVISPSQFEMHARKSYRHAIKHIFFENGKSLLELIEICKASASEPLEVALQTVISSLPAKAPSMCTKCNSSFESSSTENLLICDTCLNIKEADAEPSAATHSEVRTSSPEPNLSASNSLSISSNGKTKRGRKRKSSESALKPIKSAGNHTLSRNKKIKSEIVKRSLRSASVPRPIKSATKCTSPQLNSGKKLTMKNQQLHWSVFQKGGLPDGTELTYVAQGKKLLDGYKWGNGIFCSCCKTEISASLFEAHAGWASRKKPYENIYISNGVSLHEYAVSMKKNDKGRCPVKYNDDLCRVCGDGGDLLLCDGCPRSFHQECAGESSIPQGKWYCKYCEHSLKVDGENENALVAGRVTGIDPIEQIMTRCIRIVKHPEHTDHVACVLCRCHDFSKNVFNDRTVIVCDQCEREYHIGCLREHNMADLKALPKGKWFCSKDCERINAVLQELLDREPQTIPDNLLNLLREKQKNNNSSSETDFTSEMKFVVLSGKNATRETRKLLAQTVDIFHEGFNPIIDATSGRDFISSMVYGRKIWSQDFAGMLCAILTIDSNIVTAGTLRVFGEDIAELPIVATSKCNQGKGYFQVLFTCIERLLSSLKVKRIVLPAAEEAESIWTKKFGFETIAPDQLRELRQTCTAMMTFKGTSMLQKEIPQAQTDVEDAGDQGIVSPSVIFKGTVMLQKEIPQARTDVVDAGDQDIVIPSVTFEETPMLPKEIPQAQTDVVDAGDKDNEGDQGIVASPLVTFEGTPILPKETSQGQTDIVDEGDQGIVASPSVTFEGTSMLQKEIPQTQTDVVDAGDQGIISPSVTFEGTSMLQKEIPQTDVVEEGDQGIVSPSVTFEGAPMLPKETSQGQNDVVGVGDQGTISPSATFEGTQMLQKEIPQAQSDVVDVGDQGTSMLQKEIPQPQTDVVDAGDQGIISPSVTFEGTPMLQKEIPQSDVVDVGDQGTSMLQKEIPQAQTDIVHEGDQGIVASQLVTFEGTSMLPKEISQARTDVVDAGDRGIVSPSVTSVGTPMLPRETSQSQTDIVDEGDKGIVSPSVE
ncbi:hypothetical protein SSX86_023658 [Deinandra increscens subsp. villosa]|uniref:PHD-type domain-containing protein n=1 Tax=Deinandra increscens subsp. villosa TaxID=3103831 RepID=A0AAP0GTR7_9ASTR